jgi:hypothetical protein
VFFYRNGDKGFCHGDSSGQSVHAKAGRKNTFDPTQSWLHLAAINVRNGIAAHAVTTVLNSVLLRTCGSLRLML